jgi:hypothetical protein
MWQFTAVAILPFNSISVAGILHLHRFSLYIHGMKWLYLLIPILAFQDCKTQTVARFPSNKDDNTLLWEISRKDLPAPSYLFGTFHLMCKTDIHLSNNLRQALKNSGEVYFEMDMDDLSNTLGALLFMKMKNDTTLKDLYTPEQYKKLDGFFRDTLHISMTLLQKMKPLFLQALLYPKMMPCNTMSGMEEALMALAQENKKEIKGFETIEFQASVFDSIPYQVQANELLKSIDSLGEYKKEFQKTLAIYKSQRLSEIENMFTTSEFEVSDNQDLLLDKRNKNWVAQLRELLLHKSLFIAVGAGHLVGTNGLIALLRKEGYTLRPVAND